MAPGGFRDVAVGAVGLGSLLPDGVAAVEADDTTAPDPLFPGEAALVANAVEKRRRELALGRSCARRALARLGRPPVAILADERVPLWPPGIAGSITHCAGYCAAAVSERWNIVGIDAEPASHFESSLVARIVVPRERAQIATLDAATPWACIVFCIKEAVYKAVYPTARRFLDFPDVTVELDPAGGTFRAHGALAHPVDGRFTRDHGFVFAAVVS
jgi:4'-phosphopantetheinyl transferase EntD